MEKERKKDIVAALEATLKLTRFANENFSLTMGTMAPNVTETGTDFSFVPCDAEARLFPEYVQIVNGKWCRVVCIECDSGVSVINDIMRAINDM